MPDLAISRSGTSAPADHVQSAQNAVVECTDDLLKQVSVFFVGLSQGGPQAMKALQLAERVGRLVEHAAVLDQALTLEHADERQIRL